MSTLTDFTMTRRNVAVSVCSTCQHYGGRIIARTNTIGTRHTGAWAHVDSVDHGAMPTELGIRNLAGAMAAES